MLRKTILLTVAVCVAVGREWLWFLDVTWSICSGSGLAAEVIASIKEA